MTLKGVNVDLRRFFVGDDKSCKLLLYGLFEKASCSPGNHGCL